MKIAIGVNTLSTVDALPYGNHCKMWFQAAKDFPPETKFNLIAPPRWGIDRMRNICVAFCQEKEYDRLVFLDDDVLVPDHAIRMLNDTMDRTGAAVVSSLTYIRSWPHDPMIFTNAAKQKGRRVLKIFKDFKDHLDEFGCVEAQAIGFSLAMIDVKYLKELPPPYAITGPKNTEDVYLCCKLKDYYPDAKIIMDSNIQTGHMGEKIVVHDSVVEGLREFEYIYNPSLKGRDEKGDFGQERIQAELDELEKLEKEDENLALIEK